jgi:MFS family permease
VYVALGMGADVLSRAAFGWIGDAHDPRSVILGCYLLGLGATGLLTAVSFADAYQPIVLAACLMLIGVCNGVREPLQLTAIRVMVGTAHVPTAIRRRTSVISLSALLSPVVAGLLIGLVGARGSLAVNTGMVAVGCVLMTCIALLFDRAGRQSPADEALRGQSWYRRTRAGFSALRRIVPEVQLAVIGFVVNLSLYPVFAVLVPSLVYRHFATETWLIGVLEGAFAVGMFAGSLGVVNRLVSRFGRPATTFSGIGALGAGLLATGLLSGVASGNSVVLLVVGAPLLGMGGLGLTMMTVNTGTLRQLATPQAVRNRINACVAFISGLAVPLGSLTGGVLSELLDEAAAVAVFGVMVLLAAASGIRCRALVGALSLSSEDMVDAYDRLYLTPTEPLKERRP